MTIESTEQLLHQIYAEVIDRVAELVIAVDEHGKITFLNRGAANALHIPEGSYLGQPVRTLLNEDPPDAENIGQPMEYLLEILL